MRLADDALFQTALAELAVVTTAIDREDITAACAMIAAANKLVLYGCGREGLQMRGFAMRLHHLELDVAMQGDMTCPPVGRGDLFVASAGPGELSTVTALMQVARGAGADVLLLTAEPKTATARLATRVLHIPAQTMARDTGPEASRVLPMGSAYEGALFVLFEILVLRLGEHLGVKPAAMRARHTNLE